MQKPIQKFFASFFILQILFPGWIQAIAETTENHLPYQENAVIVQYKKNTIDVQNAEKFVELKNTLHTENKIITEVIPEQNVALIEKKPNFIENVFRSVNGFSTRESTIDMVKHYQNDPNVEFVQPNFLYKLADTTENTQPLDEENPEIKTSENIDIKNNEEVTGNNEKTEENIESANEEITENPTPENTITHQNTHEENPKTPQNSSSRTESIFNDTYFSRQWYLENNGERINGMDNYYREVGKFRFPEGTENREEKIEQFIEASTNSTENIDIDYLKAKKMYDIARNRLSESQKQKKIVAAVIDDGVNYNLPEFEGKMWNGENCRSWDNEELGGCIHGYNIAEDEKDGISKDNHTHGTNIASLIAAQSNNNEGIVGIAPDVEIMAVNIMQNNGDITSLDIVKGINFATINGADIINLSIGSARPINIHFLDTFDKLTYISMGAFPGLIINAAGNNGTNIDNNYSVVFPTVFVRSFVVGDTRYNGLQNLITVGSIQQNGETSGFSNYGINTVEVMAPGSNILMAGRKTDGTNTDLENTTYDMTNGTSFSAPITLASLAFAKSAYPERSWGEIRNIMYETVTLDDIYTNKVKFSGRLNLGNMMERLESEYQPPEPLTGEITQTPTTWTNGNVQLILNVSKDILTPQGWEKINERTFRKNISSNQNISVTLNNGETETTLTHGINNIDKTKPNLQITSPNNNTIIETPQASVVFVASDNDSKIKHSECKINTEKWMRCSSPHNINIDPNKETIFSVRTFDNAGNISTEQSISLRGNNNNNSQGNTNTSPSSSRTHQNQNTGAGGIISTNQQIQATTITPIHSLPSPTQTTEIEEEITLSSAPNEEEGITKENKTQDLPIFLKLFSEHIYIAQEYEKIPNNTEILDILDKHWIFENNTLRYFDIHSKIKLLESFMVLSQNQENMESEQKRQLLEIQQKILSDWASGKFFILEI